MLEFFQRIEGRVEGVGVEGAEAFVDEQRLDAGLVAGQFAQAQGQRQAHEEAFAARERGHGAHGIGLVVVHDLQLQVAVGRFEDGVAARELAQAQVGQPGQVRKREALGKLAELVAPRRANLLAQVLPALLFLLAQGHFVQSGGQQLAGIVVLLQLVAHGSEALLQNVIGRRQRIELGRELGGGKGRKGRLGVEVQLGGEVGLAAGGGGLGGVVVLAAAGEALGFGGGQEQGAGLFGGGEAGGGQGGGQFGSAAFGHGAGLTVLLLKLREERLVFGKGLLLGNLSGLSRLQGAGHGLRLALQLRQLAGRVGAGVVRLPGGLLLSQGGLLGGQGGGAGFEEALLVGQYRILRLLLRLLPDKRVVEGFEGFALAYERAGALAQRGQQPIVGLGRRQREAMRHQQALNNLAVVGGLRAVVGQLAFQLG